VQLCGHLVLQVDGRRRERELPGRQGRMLLGWLVLNRLRPASRDELIDAVWDATPPGAADAGLSALLSKLRRIVPLEGTYDLRLALPADASVDVESATGALHAAESALTAGDHDRAWGPAHVALYISGRRFLSGLEGGWVDAERRRLEDVHLAALECLARSGPHIGDTALATSERAARRLVQLAPFRESGYRHLMEALAAQDNLAEALRVYDGLRCLLRDELGTAPAPSLQELHGRLLARCA
jgi:DNA-binding SARP family transcriptional activator